MSALIILPWFVNGRERLVEIISTDKCSCPTFNFLLNSSFFYNLVGAIFYEFQVQGELEKCLLTEINSYPETCRERVREKLRFETFFMQG